MGKKKVKRQEEQWAKWEARNSKVQSDERLLRVLNRINEAMENLPVPMSTSPKTDWIYSVTKALERCKIEVAKHLAEPAKVIKRKEPEQCSGGEGYYND